MKLRRLITTKPHKYGTRHLTAGEEYEVPPRHAIALVAGRKARFADDKPVRAAEKPKPPAVVESAQATEHTEVAEAEATTIDRLRAEADRIGLVVDGRWGLARLHHEIAQAKR